MKKTLLLVLSLVMGTGLWAQSPKEKGMSAINRTNAEAYIGFLAHDLLEGRDAGSRGDYIAGEYIVSNLKTMGVQPFFESYFQPFESCRKERQKNGRFQVHPDSIAILKKGVHETLALRNILGVIEGKRKDEIVIIGAHYDHIGMDPMLAGDQIYNGADDNASGVSAVLQIAKAFKNSGQKPERTIIFAFWDGEEKGLLGSKYFVQSFDRISQVKGYLNFDMIGRNENESKPTNVIYFYTKAHPVFGDWLKKDIKKHKLNLTPNYRPWDRPVGGSDNGPFALKEVPVIWYHTGGHPDYSMPSDHTDRINWEKVVEITKAAYLSLWHMANDKSY